MRMKRVLILVPVAFGLVALTYFRAPHLFRFRVASAPQGEAGHQDQGQDVGRGSRKPASQKSDLHGSLEKIKGEVSDSVEEDASLPSVTAQQTPHQRVHQLLTPVQDPATKVCASVEYRGEGPAFSRVSAKEWKQVLAEFHECKALTLKWLEKNKKEFSDSTYLKLAAQVRETRIQRPPVMEDPDLSWRGVNVWTQNGKDSPLIRVGGGFYSLLHEQPMRARFELVRSLAQSWAPCELTRVGIAESPWTSTLQCLGVPKTGCENGSYSEAGWALPTAIAAQVAPLSCEIPALAEAGRGSCLDFSKRTPAAEKEKE